VARFKTQELGFLYNVVAVSYYAKPYP